MKSLRSWFVAAGAMSVLALVAGSAWAGGSPPGNNGTVKVDGFTLDDNRGNDPHVGCVLQIQFFGFDAGPLDASATLELKAPTGSGVLAEDQVFVGEDAAGGATGLDGSLTEDLSGPIDASGASPQSNQGFHVELTVHAQGSIGSDVKHKTFWVDCGGGGEEE
jgi:hypothetical protein